MAQIDKEIVKAGLNTEVLRNNQVAQLVTAMAGYSIPMGESNDISQATKDALQPILAQA